MNKNNNNKQVLLLTMAALLAAIIGLRLLDLMGLELAQTHKLLKGMFVLHLKLQVILQEKGGQVFPT